MAWGQPVQPVADPAPASTNVDALLMEWRNTQAEMNRLVARELELRNEVVAAVFDKSGKGTDYYALGRGYKLKYVGRENVKVDRDGADQACIKLEESGAVGAHIAEHLFKWDPKLSETEYKKLDETQRKIVDFCITRTPGTPALEIVEPH